MQYLVTHRAPRRAQPFITLNKMIVRGASQVLSAPKAAGARRESGDRRLWVTEEAGGQPAAQLWEEKKEATQRDTNARVLRGARRRGGPAQTRKGGKPRG